MTKHFAEELAINLLFLLVLFILVLMFLPGHNLMLALRGCSFCSDWGGELRQFVLAVQSLFSNFVLALRALGSLVSGAPMVW